MFRLDSKLALVTGASQGIGRAIAVALAEAGAAVIVSDVAPKAVGVSAVCDEIRSSGGVAYECELDVTDQALIESTFAGVEKKHGPLDILVNNAGVAERKPALEVSREDWDRVLDVNLRGTFFCAQSAARRMIDNGGGRIINISSQRAISASTNNAPYIASKAALVGLTRALALEWVQHGITVNAVGPGPVETDLVAEITPEMERAVLSRSPIGRRLLPEEITGAVVFLASPAGSGVNGHLLLVDAGWTAS